jgi:hypothetical protein
VVLTFSFLALSRNSGNGELTGIPGNGFFRLNSRLPTDNEFSRILQWPGYRVYRHEINERTRSELGSGASAATASWSVSPYALPHAYDSCVNELCGIYLERVQDYRTSRCIG